MGDGKRDELGRYTGDAPDSAIIKVVASNQPASTREIADELGMERSWTYRRLRRLARAAKIESRQIGGSLAWSVVGD